MGYNFEKYAGKANEFVKDVAERLGDPGDTDKAARVLKAVLHALRNRITIEESLQLIAQLPLFLKGVYVDGWKHGEYKRKKHISEFVDEIIEEAGATGTYDFPTEESAIKAISAVFAVLKEQVSEGEINDIKAIFPVELKQLWDEQIVF